MRLLLILISAILICSPAISCSPEPVPDRVEEVAVEPENNDTPPVESPTQSQETNMTIRVIVGDKEFKADIEESETGKAFISKLPLTLNMSDLPSVRVCDISLVMQGGELCLRAVNNIS